MTAKTYRALHCDAHPYADPEKRCGVEQGAPFRETGFRQLRQWLHSRGWHRTRDGRDICPTCWKEGHR